MDISQISDNIATFAGGCFWCTQAIFKRLKGAESVIAGYAGGDIKDPSYREVSSGNTNHAEAIRIKFDPKVISYDKLLDVFWSIHNPTTLNQQGADLGTQYRSVIFYNNEKQKEIARRSKEKIEKEKMHDNPIVTEIVPFANFYKAETYHQNYYDSNRYYPYCTLIIDPKIRKLMKDFKENVKEEYK